METKWINEACEYTRVYEVISASKPNIIFIRTYQKMVHNQAVPFLMTISFSVKHLEKNYCFAVQFNTEQTLKLFNEVMINAGVKMIVGHDLKNDLKALHNANALMDLNLYKKREINFIDLQTLKRLITPTTDDNVDFDLLNSIKQFTNNKNFERLLEDYNKLAKPLRRNHQKLLQALLFEHNITIEKLDEAIIDTNNNQQRQELIKHYLTYQEATFNLDYQLFCRYQSFYYEYVYAIGATLLELYDDYIKKFIKIYVISSPILISESDAMLVFLKMELNGLSLDTFYLHQARKKILQTFQDINEQLQTITNTALKVDSSNEMIFAWLKQYVDADLFEVKYKLSRYRVFKEIKSICTDPLVLQVCQLYEAYRDGERYLKLVEKYLLQGHLYQKVHPVFDLHGTKTGRVSSNIQQIPKEPFIFNGKVIANIRSAFVVDKDSDYKAVAYLDFNQFELRMLCEFVYRRRNNPDKNMIQAFLPYLHEHYETKKTFVLNDKECIASWNDKQPDGSSVWLNENNEPWQPLDLHLLTATQTFGQQILQTEPEELKRLRNIAKQANFALNYGGGFMTLKGHDELGQLSDRVLKDLINGYRTVFMTTTQAKWALMRDFQRELKAINFFGRKYWTTQEKAQPNAYKVINWMIQGSCADFMKLLAVWIDEYLTTNDCQSRLINHIHDEYQIEIHKDDPPNVLSDIINLINTTAKRYFTVPMEIDLQISQTNWSEKQ